MGCVMMEYLEAVEEDGSSSIFHAMDGSIRLKKPFLFALYQRILGQEHYIVRKCYQYLKAPNGEKDGGLLAYSLLAWTEEAPRQIVNILFALHRDKSWRVIGAISSPVADAIHQNETLLGQKLSSIIHEPNIWKGVHVSGMIHQPDFVTLLDNTDLVDNL